MSLSQADDVHAANARRVLDLVDQAIFEIDQLLVCAGDESDDDTELSELTPLYEHLLVELKKLHTDVVSGRHRFANGADLAFMPLVRRWKDRIPFVLMLEALNKTHQAGF